MIDAVGTTEWSYNSSGLPETETTLFSVASKPLGEGGDNTIGYNYDNRNRKTGLTDNGSLITDYSYGPLGRLKTASTANNNTYKYDYHYLTQQISSVSSESSAVPGHSSTERRLVVKNTFDILNRLTSKTKKTTDNTLISSYNYTLNNADLRQEM